MELGFDLAWNFSSWDLISKQIMQLGKGCWLLLCKTTGEISAASKFQQQDAEWRNLFRGCLFRRKRRKTS